MKNNIKTIIGLIIAFVIGISTTVGAAAIFKSEDITYSSDKTDKTNVKDSLDELYSKVGKCPEGKYCYTKPIGLSDKVELGDYISMTPTSTSYTPPSNLTGCMNDSNCTQNTLNPSELNLWRVIKKNEDGTVDVVSEYVSSKTVYFYGKTGYINYIGALNAIATQYTNTNYIQGTRYLGFFGQIESCTDVDKTICPEDYNYGRDRDLIINSIGTMQAKSLGGELSRYFVASRRPEEAKYLVRVEHESGVEINLQLFAIRTDSSSSSSGLNFGVRPILTIKSYVQLQGGDGKSAETAYTFE